MSAFSIGIGLDLVNIGDVRAARFKKRLAEYFLTKEEIQKVPAGSKEAQYLASRFALKEAVIKAFPEKLSPFEFRIEKKGSKPTVVFVDSERNKAYEVVASLTHTAEIAAAVALVHAKI
jgi:holo-[acyl-carrier-protein] synthase